MWTVTINDKWQIVIPVEARKKLGLKTGDQLMLLAKWDIALWLVKTSNLQNLIQMLQEELLVHKRPIANWKTTKSTGKKTTTKTTTWRKPVTSIRKK